MREVSAMRRLVRADPEDRWAAVFGRIAVYSFLVALVAAYSCCRSSSPA